MAHGKAVIGEAFDLAKTAFREFLFVIVRQHSGDEFFAELWNGP